MSTARFEFSFDGEAVRDGSMDVYELAPALLTAGNLVREANQVLNGDRASVAVRVESDFHGGSFDISLLLDYGLVEHAKDLLTGQDGIFDAEDLVRAIFGVGAVAGSLAGVLKLVKALKGEKPSEVTIIDKSTNIINTGSGYVANNVERATSALYESDAVRETAKRLLKPLDRTGIDSFEVRKGGQTLESFTRDEALSIMYSEQPLQTQAPVERTEVSRRNTILRLIKPSFRRGNKYQVAEGDIEFHVSIEDEGFLDDVENDRVQFSANGRLRVILRQEITPGTKKDTVEHAVESVLGYELPPTPDQMKLLQSHHEETSSSNDQT